MSKTEFKIIKLLADYPEREFYGQEIAGKVKCSKASASGILKALTAKKIIFRKTKGIMKFYRLNQSHPEIKKMRINSAIEAVRPKLHKLEKYAKKIILFGSASRGEQTAGSDIDLFIISNEKDSVRSILEKARAKSKIKAVIKTFSEWSEMEVKEPEFFREIKSGIILYDHVSRI
jgi:predicted nucleotidyltransferase